MKYALYIWGVYYIVMLIKGAVNQDLQVADNSVGIVYLIICVICWEFLYQKHRIEKTSEKNKFKKGCNIKPLKCFDVKPALKHLIRSE